MTTTGYLPPAPIRDPWGSYTWEEWFRILTNRAQVSLTTVSWSGIDFTGSNLSDIQTRPHNVLQSLQGGTSGEYYHLTAAQAAALGTPAVTQVPTSTTMSDTYQTYISSDAGVTITLPTASAARVGRTYTVIQGTDDDVIISLNGSNTWYLDTTATTITLTEKGSSMSFRCLSTTQWGVV